MKLCAGPLSARERRSNLSALFGKPATARNRRGHSRNTRTFYISIGKYSYLPLHKRPRPSHIHFRLILVKGAVRIVRTRKDEMRRHASAGLTSRGENESAV